MRLPQHLSCLLLAGIALCGIGATSPPAMADVLDDLGTHAQILDLGMIPDYSCGLGIVMGLDPTGSALERGVCPVTAISAPTGPTPNPPTISGGSNSAVVRGVAGNGPVARSTPARPT